MQDPIKERFDRAIKDHRKALDAACNTYQTANEILCEEVSRDGYRAIAKWLISNPSITEPPKHVSQHADLAAFELSLFKDVADILRYANGGRFGKQSLLGQLLEAHEQNKKGAVK
jgi:hypothetical protein